ncbi:MAG: adenylate/guanylate cyclase domain-containing protein [Nitrososphaerota archaeon]
MSLIFKNQDLLKKNNLSDIYADLYRELNVSIDYIISFSNQCQNYGVCIVDIVNSTHTTATLTNGRACMYYSIFLNSMNAIIRRFGGKVVKNIGDSLLYYFPNTSSLSNKQAFTDLLDCGSAMLGAHEIINKKLLETHLPSLSYKISADYGSVMIAHSVGSSDDDLFGSPVNMCAKINSVTPPNSMAIGHDLCQIMKSIGEYHFKELRGCSIGFKNRYPVFLAS